MSAKSWTEEEWIELVKNPDGLTSILRDIQSYADEKDVEYKDISIRWLRGKMRLYVKPESHRNNGFSMNFD